MKHHIADVLRERSGVELHSTGSQAHAYEQNEFDKEPLMRRRPFERAESTVRPSVLVKAVESVTAQQMRGLRVSDSNVQQSWDSAQQNVDDDAAQMTSMHGCDHV